MKQQGALLDWRGHHPVCECVVDVVCVQPGSPASPMVARVTRLSHLRQWTYMRVFIYICKGHSQSATLTTKGNIYSRKRIIGVIISQCHPLPYTPPGGLHYCPIIITLILHQCEVAVTLVPRESSDRWRHRVHRPADIVTRPEISRHRDGTKTSQWSRVCLTSIRESILQLH